MQTTITAAARACAARISDRRFRSRPVYSITVDSERRASWAVKLSAILVEKHTKSPAMPDSTFLATGKASKAALATLALLSGFGTVAQESDPAKAIPAGHRVSLDSAVAVNTFTRKRPDGIQKYLQNYEQALAARQYVEAETAAKQMIDYMIESGGRDESPMADALSRLALAQRFGARYEAALLNYEAAIGILEASENRLSDALVEPLRAMGDTYMASGRPELALSVYNHALHITHVNEGPHSLDQVTILDSMVTAEMQNSDADAALDLIDRMYYLYAREFAADGEEVLPVLERKAELLNGIGRHRQERLVYRNIVRIIEDGRGASDLTLLKPYTAMAHTYFYDLDEVTYRSEPTTETGETFLKKALAITEDNPDATWLMQEQVLIELGDYYTVRDVQDQARIHYRRAWELASSDPDHLERRAQDLERAVPLVQKELDQYANFGYRSANDNAKPADYIKGYVTATFTVNDRGRVTDIEIVDTDPANFTSMESRVERAVRDFVYRPRYRDGAPVYTHGQRFRHNFLYLESDLDAR